MKVSVLGAAGYTGGELLRLVHTHPELDLVQAVRDGTPAAPSRRCTRTCTISG